MLSIRIADTYWLKEPGISVPVSKRGRVAITIKDNSLDHANVPLVPNPVGTRTIDGYPFAAGQSNNSAINISTQPIQLEELFIKKTVVESMGGTLTAHLARLVYQGDIEVRNNAGNLLTADDLLNVNF